MPRAIVVKREIENYTQITYKLAQFYYVINIYSRPMNPISYNSLHYEL